MDVTDIKIRDYTGDGTHTCVNKLGGRRCDICFEEMDMSKFESVAVPFHTRSDGKRFLTEAQLVEDPYLRDFVNRFRDCFIHDMMSDCWFYIEPPAE
jgi:hypothetical protein